MRIVSFLTFIALAACTTKSGTPADAGTQDAATADAPATGNDAKAGGPLACYVAVQYICDEYPDPTPAQESDVPVACSSRSGVLSQPRACPSAGFLGKCTIGTGKGAYVQRFYTGADVNYARDFCINTAKGVWSTTF